MPTRSLPVLALAALLFAVPTLVSAARATAAASATIVVPAEVGSGLSGPPAAESAAVSIASIRVGAYEHVTVAFN